MRVTGAPQSLQNFMGSYYTANSGKRSPLSPLLLSAVLERAAVVQFVDVLGMYLIATLALMLSIDKVRRLGAPAMIVSYVAANALLSTVLYVAPEFRRWIFGFLLLAIIGAELKDRTRERRYLVKAIVVMTVAFIIWAVDFARVACAPMGIVQGHAVWHILGAVSAWYLYLHYDHVTRIRQ